MLKYFPLICKKHMAKTRLLKDVKNVKKGEIFGLLGPVIKLNKYLKYLEWSWKNNIDSNDNRDIPSNSRKLLGSWFRYQISNRLSSSSYGGLPLI